jgi:hypothetical protein
MCRCGDKCLKISKVWKIQSIISFWTYSNTYFSVIKRPTLISSTFGFSVSWLNETWFHLVRRPLFGLLYHPRMIDDECGAHSWMWIGRENRSTRRKPAPVPLCPPQIPYDMTWFRTRSVAVASRRLTAWDMARPFGILLSFFYLRHQVKRFMSRVKIVGTNHLKCSWECNSGGFHSGMARLEMQMDVCKETNWLFH